MLATLLVIAGGIVVAPGQALAAGGCYDEGCNNKYYNTGGASCTDHDRKSNVVSGTGPYSTTAWTLDIHYSQACGAAFVYVHNFTEKYLSQPCSVELYRSSNSGSTWTWVQYAFEEVETPTYNFAYSKMVGDAGATEKVRGRVVCFETMSQNWYSAYATES